jgi:SAM-dependent methyltransferase
MAGPERSPDRGHAVAAYYDRLASVYGDGEYFRTRRLAALAAVAAELDRARRVLDLGCGNGAYLAELAARASIETAVGGDLSPQMLAAARRRLGKRVDLVRADATTLPFRPGSLDVVLMSHVLQLVPDLNACAAEVARVLAHGGYLIATVGFGGLRGMLSRLLTPQEIADFVALLGPDLRPPSPQHEQERMIAACRDAGLQPELRSADLSVSGAAIEEWVRLRWLTIADDDLSRARAEHRLEEVRSRIAGVFFPFTEELIVARKPTRVVRLPE